MRRIEEEQSFEELKILRELVHERFHKQEELAEVRNPPWEDALRPATLRVAHFWCAVLLGGTEKNQWHITACFCLWRLIFVRFWLTQSLREPQLDSPGDSPGDPETSGGSGMLQYLQSWFPGWGGWYGQQSPEGRPVEGLSAEQHERWTPEEILGKVGKGLHFPALGCREGRHLAHKNSSVICATARGIFQIKEVDICKTVCLAFIDSDGGNFWEILHLQLHCWIWILSSFRAERQRS